MKKNEVKTQKPWSIKKILLVFLLVGFIIGISYIICVFFHEINYYNITFANHIHTSDEWCWECTVIEQHHGSAVHYALNKDIIKFLSIPILVIFVVVTELVVCFILLILKGIRNLENKQKIKKEKISINVTNILD